MQSYKQVVIYISSWEPLTMNLAPWKFGGHKLCGKGDTTFLICHITGYMI